MLMGDISSTINPHSYQKEHRPTLESLETIYNNIIERNNLSDYNESLILIEQVSFDYFTYHYPDGRDILEMKLEEVGSSIFVV